MCPGSRLWSLPHPTTFPASTLLPSGNAFHALPEAQHDVFPFNLNYDDHKRNVLQNASHVLENQSESEAILIVSGFLAKNYFLQRNGRRERIWFSTAMNRRAMISADKFNEPAPVRALRPDLSTLHTIAKPVIARRVSQSGPK